jgi:hypothetical protein
MIVAYVTYSHFVLTYASSNCFYMMSHKIFGSTFAKIIDLHISCKHIGWYGHDSL